MKIEIFENRAVWKEGVAGTDGENKAETLEFKFPEKLKGYSKYIEIKNKNGKFVDRIENDKYILKREITQEGTTEAQVILKDLKEDIIFKSDMFTLHFRSSINATEELQEKEQGLLDKIQLELKETTKRVQDIENKKRTTKVIVTTEEITELEESNLKDVYIDGCKLMKDEEYAIENNKIQFNFIIPINTKILIEKEEK